MKGPPVAEKRPYVHEAHGVRREDPWYWLRNRDDPAVLEYLKAENAWTEAQLAPLAELKLQLFNEMLGRIQETDMTVPAPWGPWAYYTRTEKGKAYPIFCRRPRDGGDEQIMLDANELALEHAYLGLGMVEVSPDHRWLAYATDVTGAEKYTLRIKDLSTGADTGTEIVGVSAMVAWANDSRTLWWCELDETLRAYKVMQRVLGAEGQPDTVIFEEPDEMFRVVIRRLLSGRFLAIHISNQSTTETRLVPADHPTEPHIVVQPRRRGVKYSVEIAGDSLFMITNVGEDGVPNSAINHRLLQRPLLPDGRSFGPAIERIAHRAHAELIGMQAFATHLVVFERDRGQLGLRVLGVTDRSDRAVELPEKPSVVSAGINLEYDAKVYRYEIESMTTPETVMELDIASLVSTRLREQPVPGYDRSRYRSERREAVAPDGQRIPLSLVYRADLGPGPHPTVLYAYGAYGVTIDPVFSSTRVSLLDRGVVYVIAHVRGGGFLGRSWYEQGKFEHKQNTFSDTIAAARSLIETGLTSPDRLALWGGSAGGLLVGAVINQAPELFRAAVAEVPFVDVVTTMLDESLPLTALEWEEWGDPRKKDFFDIMLAYSPFDNVKPQRYPDLLAVAGFSDPRVQYWEPAKWVARLRETATGGEFLLLTHLGAGHQGHSGRYGFLEDRALLYAWVLDKLGAKERLK